MLEMQAMAEANDMESAVPSATPLAPPETDAQPQEPSPPAAKSRGRARKIVKQAVPTLNTGVCMLQQHVLGYTTGAAVWLQCCILHALLV